MDFTSCELAHTNSREETVFVYILKSAFPEVFIDTRSYDHAVIAHLVVEGSWMK